MDANTKFPNNSHRAKEEQKTSLAEKKVEKVTTGKVKTKKRSEGSKLKDVFISEDVRDVKSYIFLDVLVPAIKNAIVDIVTDGVNMIFGTGKKRSSSSSNYVSYRDYSRRDDRSRVSRSSSRFNYDDLIFESRGEAENVRDQMDAMIDRYGVVTVADMYDMADISAPYTSNKYGWTNLRNADIVRVRDGYVIKLPRAVPID